jgi:hypothetical protein
MISPPWFAGPGEILLSEIGKCLTSELVEWKVCSFKLKFKLYVVIKLTTIKIETFCNFLLVCKIYILQFN